MSIIIDKNKCIGCGKCHKVCPGNLLIADEHHRTKIRCPEACWGCTSCLKVCKYEAIAYFLGADIGGKGSLMTVSDEGDELHWQITDQSGKKQAITTNKKSANAY